MNKSSFEEQLEKNGRLIYTNKGDSMMPLIKRDNGKHILHRVLKVRRDDYVMCGDNRWTKEYGIQDRHIIGVLTAVIRNGKEIKVTDTKYRLYVHLWCDLFPVRAFIVHVISKIRRIML